MAAEHKTTGWQPIETAPRDQLLLLSVTPHHFSRTPVKIGGWRADLGQWEIFGGSWQPTHWMPLPEPPHA